METQKKEIYTQNSKVKTPKSYWVIIGSALIVYLIAFVALDTFSFFNALGVLVGGFVMSRLIEYIYSLIMKDKNQIRRKLIQACLFLSWAILYLLMSLN